MYDSELYRTKEEVAAWKRRVPIATFEKRLSESGWLTDDDVQQMADALATEIDDAVAFVEAGPWEPVEDLEKDVYMPTSSAN